MLMVECGEEYVVIYDGSVHVHTMSEQGFLLLTSSIRRSEEVLRKLERERRELSVHDPLSGDIGEEREEREQREEEEE